MQEHGKNDLEYLKERLEALGEPELPASLSPEALFDRLDRGELTLPEEDGAQEKAPAGKVIPWQRLVRRGLPLAACLALVALVWQGLAGGADMAGGSGLVAADRAASSSAAAAAEAAPFAAANNALPGESGEPTQEEAQESAQDSLDGSAAPDNGGLLASAQQSEEGAEEKANPSTGGGGPQGGDEEGNPSTGGGGAQSGGEAEREEPDTGGPAGDAAPDISGEVPADSVGPSAAWDEAVEEQISAIAAEQAPQAGLTPDLSWWWQPDSETVEARVIYRDAAGEKDSTVIMTFLADQEGDAPVLTLISTAPEEEPAKPGPSTGRTDPDPGLGG